MSKKISFKHKFEEIMAFYGLNATSFSKEIGNIDNSAITHLLKKDSKPSLDTLNKVITRFPINLDWLLKDEGSMIIDHPESSNRIKGTEAKEIRLNSNLPVHDFAEKLGYDGINSVYYNEGKEYVSSTYQKKLSQFISVPDEVEQKATDYRDKYYTVLGKYEESKKLTSKLESVVGKLEGDVVELQKQYAGIYNILSKMRDKVDTKELVKPPVGTKNINQES